MGVGRSGQGIAVLLVCLPWWPSQGDAQDLHDARRMYLEANFRGAAGALEEVLRRPDLSEEEAAEAHRYLAGLRHFLDDAAAARRHAEAAVALNPAVPAPEGSPPEVEALLDEVRREMAGHRARLAIGAEEAGREGPTIVARLHPAPAALVATIELRCNVGGHAVSRRGPPPAVVLRLPAAADAVHCMARARTEGGAALLEERAQLELRAAVDLRVRSTPDEGSDLRGGAAAAPGGGDEDDAVAWPWIVGGGVLLAAGALLAVLLVAGSDGVVLRPRVEW